MLNLNFSKIVCMGKYIFEAENIEYSHQLFLIEDALENYKYYLIDIVNNVDYSKLAVLGESDILLESLFISEISIKDDVPKQIALILYELGFIDNIELAVDRLNDIDMSYFKVRYNFYKSSRTGSLNYSDIKEPLRIFFKVKKLCENNKYGAVVEDMGLYSLKKMIYSAL